MSVTAMTVWAINPGRGGDFLKQGAKAKAIHERLGSRVRLFQIQFGGPSSGQFAYVNEVDDMAAFAAFSDKLDSDPEWIEFWAAAGANPSATLVSRSLATEVPGF
jgi:hypothetical protein